MKIIEKVRNAQVNFTEKHPNAAYAIDLAAKGFTIAMSSIVAYTLIGEFMDNSETNNVEFPVEEVVADTVMSTGNQ